MARILVTEEIADSGLQQLRDAGHDVDVQLKKSPEELLDIIPGVHAIIIRSSTTVTRELIEAGTDLIVIGRAGIGLDNVDTEAATERGVMVVNAPQSNTLTTAEHTLAMLLAQARNIPVASAALKAGRWERKEWTGIELADKTLGIVGFGRIGSLVAQRALAFGMKIVAYDPFINTERANKLGVEAVTLDELAARSDFITLHLVKTPETVDLLDAEFFTKCRPDARVINVARGGIINEADLAAAIREGRLGGAAIDVFATEPTTESPLFDLDQVVVTPHLGASTHEAQDKAGITIAEMVVLAMAGDFVPYAVNVAAAAASETIKPFLALAERMGCMFTALSEEIPSPLEITYSGEISGEDTRILTLSVLKGAFGKVSDEPVSYVNAPLLAQERGIEVRESSTATSHDFVNLVTISGGHHSISGSIVGARDEPAIVRIDDHTVDVPPADTMLIVRNTDQPGMIAVVAQALADAGVNIDDMHLGRSTTSGAASLMVLATASAVPREVADALRSHEGIESVHVLG